MKTLIKKAASGLVIAMVFKLSIVIFIGCNTNKSNTECLVNITKELDSSIVKASSDVTITSVRHFNSRAIEMIYHNQNPLPKVTILRGQNKWDLSRFRYIAADITNRGSVDLLVELRMNENDRSNYTQFYGWNAGGQIIPAGQTRTIKTYILRTNEYPSYLDEKFVGMDALPGGIVKSFWWAPLPPDSVNHLSIVLISPQENTRIIISNIRGENLINPPSESELADNYFPFVDEFGQFKHKEWSGKVHSLDELIESKEIESEDLLEFPSPKKWNRYGGWLKGPQLHASGHFKTEKVNGKWWLVDPEGRLFWSHGIGSVSAGGATPLSGREHYFTNLPDTSQFGKFYGKAGPSFPKGYYKGKNMVVRTFRSFAWTLFKKYGDTWEKDFNSLMHTRFKSWGMNTIGTGNNDIGVTPYCILLSTGSARRIEASEGAWSKFPDPFDQSFSEAIVARILNNKATIEDSYNIGFFVDNELGWGNETYIAKAIIQSPKDQPAKHIMLGFLKNKYGSIEVLNNEWHTSFMTWVDFMENTTLPSLEMEDTRIFSAIVAEKYFSTVKETLKRVAPNKLYLGCRFDFHYFPLEDTSCSWSIRIASKYCDILSFNRYRYSADDLKSLEIDKPLLLTEWHMGALDHGMLHFSLRYAETQENRAEMYTYYVNSALQNPNCVGSHWFCYVDQPLLGRSDGENLNAGFVDLCDIPYPEMVSASRKIGDLMYDLRFEE